jgi:hypothetical protein
MGCDFDAVLDASGCNCGKKVRLAILNFALSGSP